MHPVRPTIPLEPIINLIKIAHLPQLKRTVYVTCLQKQKYQNRILSKWEKFVKKKKKEIIEFSNG